MACYRSVERQRAAGSGAGRGVRGVCGESQLVLVKTGKGHRSELNDLVAVAQCQMFHFVPVEFGSLIAGELRPRETTAVLVLCSRVLQCSLEMSIKTFGKINHLNSFCQLVLVEKQKKPTKTNFSSSSKIRLWVCSCPGLGAHILS